ncbi:MAG: bifunctional DNA primase/polymerase, partial [Bacillota bacterium]|nr:bifunctional DNA primase/polymerase [Bacillota bacterium]
GAISGMIVLDIDDEAGKVEAKTRGLPKTAASRTGGGGWHVFFRHPGFECRSFARRLPGSDLRGDGGYIVAPPSVHPSGRPYAWLDGHAHDDLPLADPPGWLLELIREESATTAKPPEHWREVIRDGAPQGQRNDRLASLCGHLLAKGVDPVVALELLLAWNRTSCRPPLTDDEVESVVISVAEREARRRGVA